MTSNSRKSVSAPRGKSLFKIGLSVFTALVLAGCGGKDADDEKNAEHSAGHEVVHAQMAPQEMRNFQIVQVRLDDKPGSVPLGGTVVSRNETTLKAQMPGRVVFIAGEEGTKLKPNQVIVALDDEGLLAKRKSALAQLDRALSAVRSARIHYTDTIYNDGVQTQGGMGLPSMFDHMFTKNASNMMGVGDPDMDRYSQIQAARSAAEQADSAVVQAQAALDEIETMLRDKQTLSPGDVVILEKYIEVGDSVMPGQPLVKVGDVSKLQVKVNLPSGMISSIRKGMKLPVALGSDGAVVPGEVERIYPSADPVSHTVTVKLAIPSDAPAAPGMYVTVSIPDNGKGGRSLPVIPARAVVWRGSQSAVFVVNNENRTEMRMVRAGKNRGGLVKILSGLRPGERIIANPTPTLSSGVQVMQSSPPPTGQRSSYRPEQDQFFGGRVKNVSYSYRRSY